MHSVVRFHAIALGRPTNMSSNPSHDAHAQSPTSDHHVPVNSWNEWDPLEEVIVGTARGAADIAYEPSLRPYFPSEEPRPGGGGPIPQSVIDDAERQLDAFAGILERRGITVRRPDAVDHAVEAATPDWQVPFGHASACPRDLLLIVGDQIIEAPMTQRARFFEYRAYRSLFNEYFRAGARWVAAPKPLMTEALYRQRDEHAHAGTLDVMAEGWLTEVEPAFDAACFARFGRDLFWQPDLVSNRLGAAWVQRQLGSGFRIHEVRFQERLPTHIDTTLVPIRPGLVLVNPARPCLDDTMQLFEANGWKVVEAPPSVRSGRAPSRDVSNWISLNILMLDERTAVVEAAEQPMIDLLKSLGCDVVPVPFDRVYPFGGGLHCCTADVRRLGTLQSYFPSLDD